MTTELVSRRDALNAADGVATKAEARKVLDRTRVLGGQRRAGIFCHITSLPGRYGCGDLGQGARDFVDFLQSIDATVWQVLPLTITHSSCQHSPYSPLSSMALDVKILDVESLRSLDLITEDIETAFSDFPAQPLGSQRADLEGARVFKESILRLIYAKLDFEPIMDDLHEWISKNAWVVDYGMYQVIKELHNGKPWNQWDDEGLKRRDPDVLSSFLDSHTNDIHYYAFEQYLLYTQCLALRDYARSRGVIIKGDLPIYVIVDSVDVWSSPSDFHIDPKTLQPTCVAGVPPDYFSATGQRWGNALPRYRVMKENQFTWWRKRLDRATLIYDAIRIDHFRGLASYWSIPAEEPTAVKGEWLTGPGQALLDVIFEYYTKDQIIVEDLGGEFHSDVAYLRDSNGLSGTAMLQLGWGRGSKYHLPHHYSTHKCVYPATHDDDTTMGWWHQCDQKQRDAFIKYLNLRWGDSPCLSAIRLCLSSTANTCIVTLQDILQLGEGARMNTPATTEGNWCWQVPLEMATDKGPPQAAYLHCEGSRKFREWVVTFDRVPHTAMEGSR